ncbi:NB-ARC domain-containing protein [Streptomyces sp. NBC_01210]|uniref:NB-ARC domain-containing protein n=1 Tax=Streptomyces sp. NBC_01210 TaxID=2903774 RepID=UPI002E0EAA68|nr:NB-ARC domain-containing protein [Streptomyces sp. NBC_01210]
MTPQEDDAPLPSSLRSGDVTQLNSGGVNVANTGVIGKVVISQQPPPLPVERPWMVPAPTGPVVERPALVRLLASALIGSDTDVVGVTTALEGAGGFGKTTLAAHVCRTDPAVRERFPGGLLWVTIGQHVADSELAAKANGLFEVLSGQPSTVSDPELAGARLGELLNQRPASLLVIDDVWSAAQLRPFLIGAPRCRRLLTTRNSTVLPRGASSILVDVMENSEATQALTAGLADLPKAALDRLSALTGRWPVLLSLVNAALVDSRRQGATAEAAAAWVIGQLEGQGPAALDIDDLQSRERAVEASMRASVSLLTPAERERYFELGVFPEDVDVPTEVAALLWAATGGMDHAAAQRLRARLVSLRLVIGTWRDGPAMRLHDVIRSYIRHRQGAARLVEHNRTLVTAARTLVNAASPGGAYTAWWSLPDEVDYLWRHLGYHLLEAGRQQELAELVCDLRWLLARIERYGPVAADADLALTDSPTAVALRKVVGQAAHLLVPLRPSLADTLLSRIDGVEELRSLVARSELQLDAPRLTALWALPDRPDPALIRTLEGHIGSLRGCAVSPDGAWLASGGFDRTVRIWHPASGSLRAALRGHTGWVWKCAVAPDGTWLASAGDDGTVRLWDVPAGTVRAVLEGHEGAVHGCAISGDGVWLASAGSDGTVRVWDPVTGALRTRWDSGQGAVTACAVSPDGTWLATSGTDGTVRLWEVPGGTLRAVLEGHEGAVNGCAVSGDGVWLASAGSDRTVRVWDPLNGALRMTLVGHTDWVNDCVISPDGTWLASAGSDRTIHVWDMATGTPRTVYSGATGGANGCAVAPDGAWVAAATTDGTVRIWRARESPMLWSPTGPSPAVAPVRDCAASPDGTWLASASTDGAVRLWDVGTASLRATLEGHTGWVRCCAAAPNGAWLASGGADGLVTVWDVATASPRLVLEGHTGWVNRCSIAPDGTWLASAGSDGTVRIWDTATGDLRTTLTGDLGQLFGCVVSPDGTWLASAGSDQILRIWDTATGALRSTLTGHTGRINDCAVSPDGTVLVSAGFDRTLRIWDPGTGVLRDTLTGDDGPLWGCALSPDGAWAATTSTNGTVRVWDLVTGSCRTAMRVEQPVRACTWLSKGSGLGVAGDAGLYLFTLRYPPSRPAPAPH